MSELEVDYDGKSSPDTIRGSEDGEIELRGTHENMLDQEKSSGILPETDRNMLDLKVLKERKTIIDQQGTEEGDSEN